MMELPRSKLDFPKLNFEIVEISRLNLEVSLLLMASSTLKLAFVVRVVNYRIIFKMKSAILKIFIFPFLDLRNNW